VEKLSSVGLREAIGAVAAWPVPERDTVWGVPVALSPMDRMAERDPVAVGVKNRVMVQVPFAATLVPQVDAGAVEKLKSPGFVPVRVILPIIRFAVPTFVSTTLIVGAVNPTVVLAKVTEVELKLTSGAGVNVPLVSSYAPMAGGLGLTRSLKSQVSVCAAVPAPSMGLLD
jgi:hypothetical protein